MTVVPHARLRTSLCDLVGVQYPIVQTGMGWVAGPKLVSATANAGALRHFRGKRVLRNSRLQEQRRVHFA